MRRRRGRGVRSRPDRWGQSQVFLVDDINHPGKVLPRAPGHGQGQGRGAEALLQGGEHGGKIRAGAIHLVDEGQLGYAELLRLPPHCFRLRLHPPHGAEHTHGAVQHAQAAFHLNGEVHMARCVDDVDGVPLPLAGCAGRRDGDAALLLFGQIIHGGGAVMHFAHAVDFLRVEEQAFAQGGLAGVDVGDDADVAQGSSHEASSSGGRQWQP